MITRRELLVRSVGLGLAGFVGSSCGDNTADRDLAVAVLEPTTDAVIVAVWARAARSAVIEVNGTEIPLELATSGSGAVDVTGLEPATAYEITVSAGGVKSGPFRAVTAPAVDDGRPVKLAIIADVDPRFENDLVDHVVAAEPDLLIGLGDLPYCDNGPDLALTAEAYRDRHTATRAHERFRPLFQTAAMRAIYDDHEFRNNWDAELAAAEPERYRAAVDVWDEFFPIRDADGEVRYRSWRWGANVECFLLDCRRFRSANADPDGDAKVMIGAEQLAWVLGAVAASTATFKLLFTSVPLDFDVGNDAWSSYQTERGKLIDGLAGTRGLVVITADQHWFAAHVHAHGIREFQFGPLARDTRTPGPAVPGVLARAVAFNFGVIEIDGETIKISAIGVGGEVLFAATLTADQLSAV